MQIVNQTQLQLNAMQVSPLDLLQAKERELTAERSYIETWRDYWIAHAELERALWGGTGGGSRASERSTSLRERTRAARNGVQSRSTGQ